MSDKAKKTEAGGGPVKKRVVPGPLPVDVKSSVPLSVQIAPESLASLGAPPAGTAEPVTDTTPMPVTATADAPVVVTASEPIPVTLDAESLKGAAELLGEKNGKGGHAQQPVVTVAKSEGLTASPTTTEADDRTTAGQRRINLIWEISQSAIATSITAAIIYCAVNKITSQDLANAFFLIVGFYFSRQNHVNIGGVGPKPQSESYTGR